MRVLILVEQGIACRYWEGAVPLLQRAQIDVVVVTLRERGSLHADLEKLGCPTLSLRCHASRDYPRAVLQLAHLIRERGIQVIHACESIPATVGGIAGVLARRGARIFHRQHCSVDGVQILFSRLASRLTHLTMAVSKAAACHAQQLDGVPPARVRVAYSGVQAPHATSTEELMALRRELQIPSGAGVISIVAHLRLEKGHRTLLEAMPLLSAALAQPPHLVIVGNGPDEPYLKARARALSPGTIHFVGHQENVSPWFALADVVAMPSYREAFGLSAAEAMACSRPLVASKVGSLEEIIEDSRTGILVTPGDPRALANGLKQILESSRLATRMGTLAHQRFQAHFTLERMVAGWLRCYREVLETRRGRERYDERSLPLEA
jgi:glycosyltransferase involved in cell wall biosynthesis